MVGNHVPERAGPLAEFAAPLDADRLGRRDLDVVDMRAIPDRLENAIGKTQRHHVLHRFLAEEMVDPIDLALAKRLQDLGVERLGGSEVVAERLLDHDPAPGRLLIRGVDQARLAEVGDDRREELGGDGQVVEPVPLRAVAGVDFLQLRLQVGISRVVVEGAACEEDPGGELGPDVGEAVADGLLQRRLDLLAEPGVVPVAPGIQRITQAEVGRDELRFEFDRLAVIEDGPVPVDARRSVVEIVR